jgi:hypothetical protein
MHARVAEYAAPLAISAYDIVIQKWFPVIPSANFGSSPEVAIPDDPVC